MTCTLVVALTLASLPADAGAGENAVHLTVQPTAAPKPALKYQLLPEVRELQPGNPYQGYIRCFMEQRNFFFSKAGVTLRSKYLASSLEDLKKADDYGGNLRHADYAARLDALDWQMTERVQNDGMNMQAAELPALQVLAQSLQARFRGQIAKLRYDDAIHGAKTMFAFARHLGEYPSPEANLTGISTAQLALDTLEEMLQQPGCPNLYWALTDLPNPLVDLHKGLQGHNTIMATEMKLIREDAPMTEADMEKVLSRLSGVIGLAREQAGRSPRNWRADLEARAKNGEETRAARSRLIQAGCDKALAEKFPPLQIILLDQKRQYEIMRDDSAKLVSLAPWQIDALASGEKHGDALFTDLLPNVIELRQTQGRLEQRIALLRCIEALRLYAAEHAGKLPEKLTEIMVPLPDDPFTGKPFVYSADKGTAHLGGGSPRGENRNVRYEVTIKK